RSRRPSRPSAWALANGRVGRRRLRVVVQRAVGVLALLLELGDVGARRERHGTGAAVDDRADGVVLPQPLGHAGDLRPHREADRVAHRRPVEDDRRDRPVLLHENVRHAFHLDDLRPPTARRIEYWWRWEELNLTHHLPPRRSPYHFRRLGADEATSRVVALSSTPG